MHWNGVKFVHSFCSWLEGYRFEVIGESSLEIPTLPFELKIYFDLGEESTKYLEENKH